MGVRQMKTYNLYCDESCHLQNDGMPFMLLGYLKVPYNHLKHHKKRLKTIREEHHFYPEIKWSKVSGAKTQFYLDLLDYFFETDLSFRAIVIRKNQLKHFNFSQSHDEFYYKMYYQLLGHKIDMIAHYNIYLDIKDTLSAIKVKKLQEILQTQFGVIRNLQNIHSKESIFLQLADLLMGAVSYELRGLDTVKAKTKIIEKIKNESNVSLDRTTILSEEKFNLFFIELK